jgi:hypothetical protein
MTHIQYSKYVWNDWEFSLLIRFGGKDNAVAQKTYTTFQLQ